MRLITGLIFFSLILGLSSCIEIIDDISINDDGSGTFRYNINLSSSKVKINSLLALDSLDSKKMPSVDDIKSRINKVILLLKTQEGISNLTFTSNYSDFVFKLECDFQTLELLQKAIREVVKSENKHKEIPELEKKWISFEDDVLIRSIPRITVKKFSEINRTDTDLLKSGNYTSITRFEKEVEKIGNVNAVLSKNLKAVMIRTDPYSLTQNIQLLDNTIYLVKSDE